MLTHVLQGPDARLTPFGLKQAQIAHDSWVIELGRGAPLPQTFISSPLSRAASTLNITWSGIDLLSASPVFQEQYRETIGLHTCDRRRTKTYLRSTFPTFRFEDGFSERDLLWTKNFGETATQQTARLRRSLDRLFASDPHVCTGVAEWPTSPRLRLTSRGSSDISITAHGGTIAAILTAVGHRHFSVQTGGTIQCGIWSLVLYLTLLKIYVGMIPVRSTRFG